MNQNRRRPSNHKNRAKLFPMMINMDKHIGRFGDGKAELSYTISDKHNTTYVPPIVEGLKKSFRPSTVARMNNTKYWSELPKQEMGLIPKSLHTKKCNCTCEVAFIVGGVVTCR
jgi:hypothetical protein